MCIFNHVGLSEHLLTMSNLKKKNSSLITPRPVAYLLLPVSYGVCSVHLIFNLTIKFIKYLLICN